MAEKPHILLLGVEKELAQSLQDELSQAMVTEIKDSEVERIIDNPPQPTPVLVLCGPLQQNPPANEVAQLIRIQLQETACFFVSEVPSKEDRSALLKNGFHDVFVKSVDLPALKAAVVETFKNAGKIKSYRPVMLLDIQPETVVNFDLSIHLPVNNKYIKLVNSGDPVSKEQTGKLKKHGMNSVFVTTDQLQKFYSYSADLLKKMGANQTISETERKERLHSSVRNLLSGIISNSKEEASFETGRTAISDCQKIVKTYVLASNKGQWYQSVLNVAGDDVDHYSHTSNVSTYAALFSMALGVSNPEDMAVAGLLHDTGLAKIPLEIQQKAESDRTVVEQDEYKKHVEYTLDMIKQKKVILPENVLKAIAQHHERCDGTGYPKSLSGKKLTHEAQVLALADEFDKLTRVKSGDAALKPLEAVHKIAEESQKRDILKAKFDPELIDQWILLFPKN